MEPIPAIVADARASIPDRPSHVVNTFINQDINDLINHDLDSSLRVTVPLTFLILLLAFGAIVASLVPLVLAATSLLAAFGMIGLYSQTVGDVSPNATQLIVLIGLAVAVDYSLLCSRASEPRDDRADPSRSRSRWPQHAVRAVFFWGWGDYLAVRPIHAGDTLFPRWRSSRLGGLVSVIVMDLLPATLAIFFDR